MTIESDLFRPDPAPLIARGLPDLPWVPWGIRVTAQALGDRSPHSLAEKISFAMAYPLPYSRHQGVSRIICNYNCEVPYVSPCVTLLIFLMFSNLSIS